MSTAPTSAPLPERPMPTPTRESQPYWDGMREGRRGEAQQLAATAESAFSRGLAAMDAVRGVLEGV